MAWNSLPDFIRDPTSSTDCFRRLFKTYLLARYVNGVTSASRAVGVLNDYALYKSTHSLRVVSVLDSGAARPGFKSQRRRCRVTVLGKLFTPVVPVFTKRRRDIVGVAQLCFCTEPRSTSVRLGDKVAHLCDRIAPRDIADRCRCKLVNILHHNVLYVYALTSCTNSFF